MSIKTFALAIGMLTGCHLGPQDCYTAYESSEAYGSEQVSSGLELVATTWFEGTYSEPDKLFAALVSSSGVMSPAVQLPVSFARSTVTTAGHASAIWMQLDDVKYTLTATVVSGHDVRTSLIAKSVTGISTNQRVDVAFDGHAYQMFWLADGRLQHEEVSELGLDHATRRGTAAQPISEQLGLIEHQVAAVRGEPTLTAGSADPADLAHGALRQAMVEFNASDYRAVLRATNMGDGFVLSEQYALVN